MQLFAKIKFKCKSTSKIYSIVGLIGISILFSTRLIALPLRVIPTFNHFWYTAATDTDKQIVCDPLDDIYSYTNKETSEQNMLDAISHSLPLHPNCTWQPLKLYVGDDAPPDFPGDSHDYEKVMAGGTNLPTVWSTQCLTAQGGYVDARAGEFYPSYACPKGSKKYYPNTATGADGGCYKVDHFSCYGDVVGRDLAHVPTIIASQGHVALVGPMNVWSPTEPAILDSSVLEVLNKDPVIRLNSLTSFMNAVPGSYWGAKYSLSGYPELTTLQAIQMFIVGVGQMKYQPTYTLGWNWWPGGPGLKYKFNIAGHEWKIALVTFNGQFRCDTFVYYLFKAGAKIIIPYASFMTPKHIFDAFLKIRSPNPLVSSKHVNMKNSGLNNLLFETQNTLEDQIKQLFANSSIDANQADQLTYTYINDTSITRSEKVTFLWGLAKQYETSTEKFSYLINVLSYLKPVSLANGLIGTYKALKETASKLTLIALMNNSIYYDTLQEAQALTATQLNGVITIEQFLNKQLATTRNKQLYRKLYFAYLNLLDQKAKDFFLHHVNNVLLTKTDKQLGHIVVLYSNQKNFSQRLQTLSTQYNSTNFDAILCSYTSMLPKHYLSITQKNVLHAYFELRQSKLNHSDAKMKGCNVNPLLRELGSRY